MKAEPRVGYRPPLTPESRLDGGTGRRVNRWLVAAVALLAMAVVALGAALIVQAVSEDAAPTAPQGTQAARTEGLADPAMVALVDEFLAAYSTEGATAAIGTFWGEDSVRYEYNPWVGMIEMPLKKEGLLRFQQVKRAGPVIQVGSRVVFPVTVNGRDPESIWVLEWSLDPTERKRIVRVWAF